jgi:hypothetical protein
MEIEHALLLPVPLHVNGSPCEGTRHEPSVTGSFPGRSLEGDVKDLRDNVFSNVPALGRSPDHARDLVPDRVMLSHGIGKAFEIAVL